MTLIINHTDKAWQSRVKRTNGALVYSTYICNHDVPIWRALCGDAPVVISTCPIFSEVSGAEYVVNGPELAVQYLHTFPKDNPVQYVRNIIAGMPWRAKRVVFITAYKSYAALLRANGIKAYWLPVRIDTGELRDISAQNGTEIQDSNRFLWFGNVYTAKRNNFAQVQSLLQREGFAVDVISEDKLNGRPISRREVLQLLPRYRYGAGVGQCAMEMMYMGLRVMITGDGFGGIITNAEEWAAQRAMNLNSRVCTYDNNPANCISYMRHGMDMYYPDFEADKQTGAVAIQQIIAENL